MFLFFLLDFLFFLSLLAQIKAEIYFQITSAGYQAILSAPWYMNYIKYGSDWAEFYQVEPMTFTADENQKKLLLGGEGSFVTSRSDDVIFILFYFGLLRLSD